MILQQVDAKKILTSIAKQLGYGVTYLDTNYIKTYGNLPENEAAYFLQNHFLGYKGTIAWEDKSGFFAHRIDETGKTVWTPFFQDEKEFLACVLQISALKAKNVSCCIKSRIFLEH